MEISSSSSSRKKKSKKQRSKAAAHESNASNGSNAEVCVADQCSLKQCSQDPSKELVQEDVPREEKPQGAVLSDDDALEEMRRLQKDAVMENFQRDFQEFLLKADVHQEVRIVRSNMRKLLTKDDFFEEIKSLHGVMQTLKDDLREYVVGLRGDVQTLKDDFRQEVQTLRGDMVLKGDLHEVVQCLRGDIQTLLLKNEELQGSVTSLNQERDEMCTRMLELETQQHHLQVVPSPSTGTESSAAAAEDLKLQQAASAALMMEKLVAENAELTSKLNDQSVVISQLTSGSTMAAWDSTSDRDVRQTKKAMMMKRGLTAAAADPGFEGNTSSGREVDSPGSPVIRKSEEQVDGNVQRVGADDNDERRPFAHDGEVVVVEEEEEERKDRVSKLDSAMKSEVVQVVEQTTAAVPFSDAPLMGAPLRVMSFVARFVSGADLVKSGG